MSSTTYSPGGMPLGGATVSGTLITIDDYVNPPTRIPQIVRELVAGNEGYFIENVFSTPGFTVEGGAVLYTPTFPTDLFLDPNQSIVARAPGAEAALIGGKRYEPLVARPESKAGRIEVTDEARQRNNAISVRNDFVKAANTFMDFMQTRGLAVLNAAISTWGRSGSGVNWRTAHTTGLIAADPATLPGADFDAVLTQFIADKAGVRPDTVILHQNDASALRQAYSGPFSMKLHDLLDDYGIKNMIVSPLQTEGTVIFCKSNQVGYILWEKPLDQEYERAVTRKTDVFVLEMRPVFFADDASAVFALTGINS